MKKGPVYYTDLDKISIIKLRSHNHKVFLLTDGKRPFPEKAFVRKKSTGLIRFVTKHSEDECCFEDDGQVSMAVSSQKCKYKDYDSI